MEEEIYAIQAIYCGDGEFETIQNGGDTHPCIFALNLKCECSNNESDPASSSILHLTFSRTPGHLDTLPDISISSKTIGRNNAAKMKSDLLEAFKDRTGEPVLLEMIQWVQEMASMYIDRTLDKQEIKPEAGKLKIVLLHLDHMRAKGKYIKTIQKWTEELNIQGRLIFHDNLIFILLQGCEKNIKEYISRQRSVNIDVDSKGRSCKERMLRVLGEIDANDSCERFEDFAVEELASYGEIEQLFCSRGLHNLFVNHINSFYRKK